MTISFFRLAAIENEYETEAEKYYSKCFFHA
jgi:hypothetical protein